LKPKLDHFPPNWIRLSPEVQTAREASGPIVALESTVITHGLPRPVNLELARRLEGIVREAGATPATVAVLGGELCIGLDDESLERLALDQDAIKASRRELAWAHTRRLCAGTTVAATMALADLVGIRVFATGGIGGVHRGGTGDVSADLPELTRSPLAVVCAGAKSILDLPRTLEWLETASVPVIGWQTEEFPAFFSRESGLPVSFKVDTVGELAQLLLTHWQISPHTAALVCVPCPAEEALEQGEIHDALERAEAEAAQQGISGQALTPFLLTRLSELTGGATLGANLALLRHNAHIAAELAKALSQQALPDTT
jgi:pseudouridine-5'-phosphate glycosidase